MKDFNKKMYIIIALIFLFVPASLMPFFKNINEKDIIEYDNRYATTLIDVYNSAEKQVTFERWFSDHLAFRKNMVSAWATMNHRIKVSCRPNYIVVGKGNWLFLGNQFSSKLDKYRNAFKFDEKEIDNYIEGLSVLNDFLSENDKEFLFVIAPNKESIYPEHMPKWATLNDSENYTKEILKKAEDNLINEYVLNLTPSLTDKKTKFGEDLYYKSDGHWSTLGAFFGYDTIMDNLSYNYNSKLNKIKFLEYKKADFDGYSLQRSLGMIGQYNDFKTYVDFLPQEEIEEVYLEEKKTWKNLQLFENKSALNNQKILIIRDSFANAMIPYFYNTFNNVYVVHYHESIFKKDELERFYDILDKYDPDIVILEIVERRLSEYSGLFPYEYRN